MSRWKRSIFAVLFVFASTSLSANSVTEFLFSGCDFTVDECCTPCNGFSGFYIGVAGGIANNLTDTSVFSCISITDESVITETEDNVYQIRPWGEVYGGWGWQFCWLYLGGRLGANFSKFDSAFEYESIFPQPGGPEIITNINRIKTELRVFEFTLDFKPGIVFCNNTMLFALFGAAWNKQHLSAQGDITRTTSAGRSFDHFKKGRNRSFAGFRGGAGIEYLFCNCLSFNLTYVFTRYWDLDQDLKPENTVTVNSYYLMSSSKAYKQVTSMGISYYF